MTTVITRRRFVALIGTAAVAGVAGCTDDDEQDGEGVQPEDEDEPRRPEDEDNETDVEVEENGTDAQAEE